MQHGMVSITVQMRLVRNDFTCLSPFRTSSDANRLSLGYGLSLFAEKIIKKYETSEGYGFDPATLVFLQALSEAAEKHEALKTRVEQTLRLLILWHQRHEVKNQVVCCQNVYLTSLRNGIELNLSFVRQLSFAQYQQLHKLYSSERAAQNLIICKTLLSELNSPVRAATEKHPVLRPVIKPHSLAKSFRAVLESVAHASRAPGGRELFPNPVINQFVYRLTGKKTGDNINFENKLPDMTRVGYPAPYERRQAFLPRANLVEAVNILNILNVPAGRLPHAGQGEFAATPGARERLDTGRHSVLHSVLPRLSALLFSREYRREIFHLSPARGRLAQVAPSFPAWRQFTESEKLDGTSLTLKQYTSSQQHFVWSEIEKLVNQYKTVEKQVQQHTTAEFRQFNQITVPAGRRPITDSRAATVNRDRDETIFQMVKAVMNREMAPGQTGQNLMWGLAQNIKHQWFSSGRVYQYRTPEAAASLTGSKPAAKAQIIHVFKESPAWAAGLKDTGSRSLIPWPGSFTSAGRLEAPVFAGEQRRQMRQARRQPQALLTRANLMEAVNVPAGYLPYAAQGEFAAVPGVKERLDTGRHSVLPRLSALLFAPSFPDRRQFTKSERTRIIEPGTREEKVLVFAAGNNFEFSRPIPDSQAATVFKITKAVMNREMAPGQTSQNLMWSLAQNIKHLWFSSGRERQYRTPQAAASRTGSMPAAKAKIIHIFKESPAWAAGPKDTGSGSLIPRPDSFTSAGKHEAPAFAGAKRHHVYPLRQQPPLVAARPAEAAAHAALFPPGPQMVTREEQAAKAGNLRPTAGKPASATIDRILNMSSSNVILINRYQMRRQTADTVTLPDVRDQVDLKNNAPVMVHASDKAQGAERQKATRSMPSQRELINRFGNLVADPNVPPSELIDAQAGSLSSDASLGVPGKAQHVSELIKKITLGERIIREEQRKVSEITQKVEAQEDVINKLNQAYQQLQEDLAARLSEKRITAVIMKELRARLALDKMRYGLQ